MRYERSRRWLHQLPPDVTGAISPTGRFRRAPSPSTSLPKRTGRAPSASGWSHLPAARSSTGAVLRVLRLGGRFVTAVHATRCATRRTALFAATPRPLTTQAPAPMESATTRLRAANVRVRIGRGTPTICGSRPMCQFGGLRSRIPAGIRLPTRTGAGGRPARCRRTHRGTTTGGSLPVPCRGNPITRRRRQRRHARDLKLISNATR
jgi:hypothetical protein